MVNRLREIRESRGERQKDIANLFGVSVATYSKKELGCIKVSLEEAYIASLHFGVSLLELFFTDTLSPQEND